MVAFLPCEERLFLLSRTDPGVDQQDIKKTEARKSGPLR